MLCFICLLHPAVYSKAYRSLGKFYKAIAYHEQHLTMTKEVRDRAGEGRAYGSLGNAYGSLGDFSKAIEYHPQDLAIAKEVGDRAGEGIAYGNLGTFHMHLNEYDTAGSPKDGFEKNRIGRESDDGAAQGYLRSTQQVARGCQRRCGV